MICTKCGAEKPEEDFPTYRDNRFDRVYRSTQCRNCYRTRINESKRLRWESNPKYRIADRERQKLRLMALRSEFLVAYGGECICCGETEDVFLTLEHMALDGARHRREVGGGHKTYADLKKRGWPKNEYTILCANCNMAKAKYGICPHQQPNIVDVDIGCFSRWRRYKIKVRQELLVAYGNTCSCCFEINQAFLTLEHLYGGGRKHRDAIGHGHRMHLELKRLGWPKDRYTLLCMNCNMARGIRGTCPHQSGVSLAGAA